MSELNTTRKNMHNLSVEAILNLYKYSVPIEINIIPITFIAWDSTNEPTQLE